MEAGCGAADDCAVFLTTKVDAQVILRPDRCHAQPKHCMNTGWRKQRKEGT